MSSLNPYSADAYAAQRMAEMLCESCRAQLAREVAGKGSRLLRRLRRQADEGPAADPAACAGCGCTRHA